MQYNGFSNQHPMPRPDRNEQFGEIPFFGGLHEFGGPKNFGPRNNNMGNKNNFRPRNDFNGMRPDFNCHKSDNGVQNDFGGPKKYRPRNNYNNQPQKKDYEDKGPGGNMQFYNGKPEFGGPKQQNNFQHKNNYGPKNFNNQNGHMNQQNFVPKKTFNNQNVGQQPTEYNGRKMQSMKAKHPGDSLVKPMWDMANLEPIQKDFYKPHADVESRSEEDVKMFRSTKEIIVSGNNVPRASTRLWGAWFRKCN